MTAPEALTDEQVTLLVHASETVFAGKMWDVRRDDVELSPGSTVTREVLVHPGAVGVVALDEQERVLLVRQYRHPVGSFLWEPPAGLLDVDGEDPLDAAQRELAEEADLRADTWHLLVDFYNSPGGSTEAFRCYLASDLSAVPQDERHDREGEEAGMQVAWLALDEAYAAIVEGRLHNPTAVVGILAARAARAADWSTLRPADAPWPERSPGR